MPGIRGSIFPRAGGRHADVVGGTAARHDELLLTMPITPWQAIVGKFPRRLAVSRLALALTFPIVITVNYLGHPDNGVILAGYIGSFLMPAPISRSLP